MGKIKFKDWDLLTKINYYQRKIILNCIMYYDYDKSFLTDNYYDSISHELVKMQKELDKSRRYDVKRDTTYGYMMYDFDGNTGFDLPKRLNPKDYDYLNNICAYKLFLNDKKQNNNKKTIKKRGLF
jgi:hypothetical protein|nr:MAG TPA: hypothetical protein [Caudoviricetes sp.]